MNRITSLRIDWYDNGLTCGDFIVHQVISVYRNKKEIVYKGFNGYCKEPQETETCRMQTEPCEQLFMLLEQAEARHDFKMDYRVVVCDGSAWEMRLRHSDNTISLIEGTVGLPDHGDEIERFIRTAIDKAHIFTDPMIFGCGTYDNEEDE